MTHNTETVRGTGSFRVRDGSILLFRVGPANAQRQRHNRRPLDLVTGQRAEWPAERGDYADHLRRTPEPRGIWAFPYPFQDAFFYHHVWRRHMPKAFREGAFDHAAATDGELQAHYAAEQAAMREVRRTFRPKLVWHRGPFYSHVRPVGMAGGRHWWRYENPRDFVQAARRELWTWHRDGDHLWRANYSSDHLEVFVPG